MSIGKVGPKWYSQMISYLNSGFDLKENPIDTSTYINWIFAIWLDRCFVWQFIGLWRSEVLSLSCWVKAHE